MRAYNPPSWLTAAGVHKKRKLIEAKGLPSFQNWRFITLTLDPELFEGCPLAGYLAGKDHMRRFLAACRKAGLWSKTSRWAWKMEFQSCGWAHWHLLVDRKSKMSEDEMRAVARLWALGRTNIERVNTKGDFLYSFKYAFKAIYQSDSDSDTGAPPVAPDWFLDYHSSEVVKVTNDQGETLSVLKSVTFARVRFWQTSKGFYTAPEVESPDPSDPVSSFVPVTVRQVSERLQSQVQVVCRDVAGTYKASAIVALAIKTSRFWHLAGWHTLHGAAVGFSVESSAIPTFLITQNAVSPWTLKPILRKNSLTLPAAATLSQAGRNLLTS